MSLEIGLDYETYSDIDIKQRGLPNYIASENFRPLCVSVSVDGEEYTFDFVFDCLRRKTKNWDVSYGDAIGRFKNFLEHRSEDLNIGDRTIIAVNAGFERAVTHWLVPDFNPFRFEDAAVDARCVGAEGKLEVASRQLTDTPKKEVGEELIQVFCVPNDAYPTGPTAELIEANGHMDLWLEFIDYCEVDAKAGLEIRQAAREILEPFDPQLLMREALREQITWEMNQAGWHIDRKLVLKMKQRAWANGIIAERMFNVENANGEPVQINFNSHQQVKKFLAERGLNAKSTDKYHLPVYLKNTKDRIAKLEVELQDGDYPETRRALGRLKEIEMCLETKLEIGGSALTKLPRILDLVSDDDILRDQYIHVGAPQTYRSSGRGVQMQNIKKLDGNIADVNTIYNLQHHWSNGDMAGQLRQVFTSRHPDGEILVGDFAGVESRGLAYEAGEEWKLDTFRQGKDVYCMLVTKFIPGLTYEEVADKNGEYYLKLRPRGKYSELSCGYQASGKAVQDFMFRLGFSVTLEDATQNVTDWRDACSNIVAYWELLDDMIKDSVRANMVIETSLSYGMQVRITPFKLPSIQAQHPGALSLCIQILVDGRPYVTRFVHGCYFGGNQLRYYKPSKRLNQGLLWQPIDITRSQKKSAELGREVEVFFGIYGGKLAGILTQSLCRELFFDSLEELRRLFRLYGIRNAVICGQFHDEINVDWWPAEDGATKEFVKELMTKAMKKVRVLRDFPLDVEVKSAYRYIK